MTNSQLQNVCIEAIPPNCLVDFLNRGVAPVRDLTLPANVESEDLSWVDWRAVLRHHQTLNYIPHYSDGKGIDIIDLDFDAPENPITSLKMTGDIVLTGHYDGLLCVWSADSMSHLLDIWRGGMDDLINDIVLGDVFLNGPYQLTSTEEKRFKYFTKHHFIIMTTTRGRVFARGLGLSDIVDDPVPNFLFIGGPGNRALELARHHTPGVYASILADILGVFSRENIITLWKITVPSHFEKSPSKLPRFVPHLTLTGPTSMIYLGSLWPNRMFHWMKKLVVVTTDGRSHTYQIDQESWLPVKSAQPVIVDRIDGEDKEKKKGRTSVVRVADLRGQVSAEVRLIEPLPTLKQTGGGLATSSMWAQMFHDNVVVIVNKMRQLLISVDSVHYRLVDPCAKFPGEKVSALTYSGNVMFIGTTLGRVMSFHVKNSIDLMTLDFQKPTWIEGPIQCLNPVVKFDVAPCVHEAGVLNLAVAFSEFVAVLKFPPVTAVDHEHE